MTEGQYPTCVRKCLASYGIISDHDLYQCIEYRCHKKPDNLSLYSCYSNCDNTYHHRFDVVKNAACKGACHRISNEGKRFDT